jgi:PTS system mannose-specific IIA component
LIEIIVTSHGEMAEGLLDAARIIIGDKSEVEFVSLKEDEDIEDFEKRMIKAIEKAKLADGILIMADLFGATPANISTKIALGQENIEVITGMNLPMFLEIALKKDDIDLQEAIHLCTESGKESIKNMKKYISDRKTKNEK